MGGSGGGGTFSGSALERLREAADQRLRQIATETRRILFICEREVLESLESHLKRSPEIGAKAWVEGGSHHADRVELVDVTLLVAFTNATVETPFIDRMVDRALESRIAGVHVRAAVDSVIPSKVTAYRWKSVSWEELEKLLGV